MIPSLKTGRPALGRGAAAAAVLALLEQGHALTRSELASGAGMPLTTVNSAVGQLLRSGLVQELAGAPADKETRKGRPAARVALATDQRWHAVLSVGVTSLTAAVMGSDGAVRALAREPFVAYEHDEIVEPAVRLLLATMEEAGIATAELAAAVIAVPMPYGPRGGAVVWQGFAPSSPSAQPHRGLPAWITSDPAEDLARLLGVAAYADNDSNLAALGEATFGAAAGMRDVIYVQLLPIVSGGIIVNGEPARGASGFAGELCHLHVVDDGPLCICGGRGCLHTLVNTRAITDLIRPVSSATVTFEDALVMADEGHPGVQRIFTDVGHALGGVLATACVLLNPQAIVIGGTSEAVAPLVIDAIAKRIQRDTPSALAADVSILAGSLSDPELLGAVALARARVAR